MKNIGRFIEREIENQGVTKKSVAEKCNIPYKTFVDKINNNRFTAEELLIISDELDIELDELKNHILKGAEIEFRYEKIKGYEINYDPHFLKASRGTLDYSKIYYEHIESIVVGCFDSNYIMRNNSILEFIPYEREGLGGKIKGMKMIVYDTEFNRFYEIDDLFDELGLLGSIDKKPLTPYDICYALDEARFVNITKRIEELDKEEVSRDRLSDVYKVVFKDFKQINDSEWLGKITYEHFKKLIDDMVVGVDMSELKSTTVKSTIIDLIPINNSAIDNMKEHIKNKRFKQEYDIVLNAPTEKSKVKFNNDNLTVECNMMSMVDGFHILNALLDVMYKNKELKGELNIRILNLPFNIAIEKYKEHGLDYELVKDIEN